MKSSILRTTAVLGLGLTGLCLIVVAKMLPYPYADLESGDSSIAPATTVFLLHSLGSFGMFLAILLVIRRMPEKARGRLWRIVKAGVLIGLTLCILGIALSLMVLCWATMPNGPPR